MIQRQRRRSQRKKGKRTHHIAKRAVGCLGAVRLHNNQTKAQRKSEREEE